MAMALADLLARPVDTSDPAARDPEFIRTVALPLFTALRVHYFRAEIEGAEHVPDHGPFIVVANHNGGPILPDVWVLAGYWWSLYGVDRPSYAMVHDAALSIPLLRTFLMKVGGLRASRENAAKVLRQGAPVLIYPGGELDCLKSFWRRHTIDFHGRAGFVRLALEHGVPIVPLVNVGGHEVYITLFSSERLARWTGLSRCTHVKTVPVNLGLPWGVWATGLVPFLPLPAKFAYRVGPPIALGHDPEAARDERVVKHAYDRVTGVMQEMLDGLAARRRLPVFG